jgi:hypothetical protein
MIIKFLTLVVIFFFSNSHAHAGCENFLRGLEVESQFRMGSSWDATYFQVKSESLRARTVVQAKYSECTDNDCKQKLNLLENAKWNHQLLKFNVSESTCEKIWSYFILIDGGGTAENLPLHLLTEVSVDSHYPF